MTSILIVGSGAREHAIAWKLSAEGARVHVAPGNAGCDAVARTHAVAADDVVGQVALAKRLGVDLVIVGPEAPLVAGLVDALGDAGIAAFGPSRSAARLEGSKVFAKETMTRCGVPTAAYRVFDDADEAEQYVRRESRPLVVKADGLAAGKGVVVAANAAEAVEAIEHMMRRRQFGDAGERVVIEDCLVGEEVSYHVVSDGERYVALAAAQDHKRALDGDRGPNTGGMGAYSPPYVVTAEIEAAIRASVVEPTLRGMREHGAPFRGALFVGLMISRGQPWVLEYNVRFGDPETEALMARWGAGATELFRGSALGDLSSVSPQWSAPCALCVVLASRGYPGSYESGKPISGLDAANAVDGVTVFHAGTRRDGDRVLTAGGRVLTVTATGETIDVAAERAYRAADLIEFEGKQLRRDIGWRARGG